MVFSEEAKAVLQHAVEAITAAWEEMFKELAELACEVQEKVEARKEERERWGHPPKRLLATYNQPVKKIRPCARSFGRR